ncbi:MAG TPA: cobyrinic acid a,c-diamide synthase, partial [Nocardioidaceae bacterium]|nr:cobyrinic acid a,c-diamide synthase [Nocardioidaceae bacterium]
MSRRVSLPAADDLFRPTTEPRSAEARPVGEPDSARATEQPTRPVEPDHGRQRRGRQHSGRVRHDEKMTVYVTSDELLDLEHARLLLRREHDLGVDRGRIVRAAVALALADLDTNGEDSAIVQRLK